MRIARYRCDNETRRGQFWREKRVRRVCGEEEENYKHIIIYRKMRGNER